MTLLSIDPISLLAYIPAHYTVSEAERRLASAGFTLGLSGMPPESLSTGDWVAEGSAGAPDPYLDPADHLVAGLKVSMPDGRKLTLHPHPRRSTGPDLMTLFLGGNHRFGRIDAAWIRVHRTKASRPTTAPFRWPRNPPVSVEEDILLRRLDAELQSTFPPTPDVQQS